jgi:hypothetical protein
VEVWVYPRLTSALDRSVVNTTPWPPERTTGTHCAGGWVSPKTGLNGCRKCLPCWSSHPDPSRVDVTTTLLQSSQTLWQKLTVFLRDKIHILNIGYYAWSEFPTTDPGFDSRLYHGDISLKGKIPMVTMVWVV